MSNFKEDLLRVRAFAFDVDGVLSGTKAFLYPDGQPMRSTNMRDGYAIRHALKRGFPVAVITGGISDAMKVRFEFLGIKDVYTGVEDKIICLNDFVARRNITTDGVLYMGDDLPDQEVMKVVGIPTCPNNAVEEIKSLSKYISDIKGGEGCVRDVIEQVLRAQKMWT